MRSNKTKSFVLFAAMTVCAFWTSESAHAQEKKTAAADQAQKDYELMKVFVETFEQIDRNYVKDVDRRELMEAAIKGMLGKLDQYSSYIDRDDVQEFNESVDQEFGGVGIQVAIDPTSRRLTVITPLPGTPAYNSGVKAGDVIMEIGGKDTEGFTMNDAIKLLKGPAGGEVTIGVRHMGATDIEQIKITRAIIQVPTVLGEHYGTDGQWDYMFDDENRIGYIHLSHFSRRSAAEMHDVVKKLVDDGMKGLVIDLRNNPGGLLSQAIEICDMFVDEGVIVSTKGRNTPERSWKSHKRGTYRDFPIAVIVNRFSASASEILSACLQDYDRAVVVGERTWGKGSVQNVINLEGGASALKLTTASYHRPSGKNIHRFPGAKEEDEWGVVPNEGYKIRLSRQEMFDLREYRRRREVIGAGEAAGGDFVDRQFQKALEVVKEKIAEKSASN